MENNSKLMFIGEIINNQEIRITRKPSIYDVFLLSEKSFSTFPSSMNLSYQSVPLEEQANISIHINCYHIILSYQHNSLQIAEKQQNSYGRRSYRSIHQLYCKERGQEYLFRDLTLLQKTAAKKEKRAHPCRRKEIRSKPVPVTVNGIFTVFNYIKLLNLIIYPRCPKVDTVMPQIRQLL